ncbi:MAG: hypothetical protein M3Q03_00320 [Chloroflexota bacterium]|nr:hypothetical protein [Chloroflexota bacterium]
MRPRIEQAPREAPEASPLWPLVLLLAEIASRIERQEATAARMRGTADQGVPAEFSFSILSGDRHEEDRP